MARDPTEYDPTEQELEDFFEAMARTKEGVTNPGKRNRAGCRFPHCACNNPWEACDLKLN
ncbi:MAG: hypothetical protein ACJ8CB_17480 [Ktedonobacteraceae bacterium]